ncbi:acyltransferase [Sinomonas sp. ASV322]|uniref:acyltransferase family protein n=1 Tax=Sinomonas sp. ASV322 TaxID=3041920 RepID=UPI0027DE4968|nr:acyltransferase [Sinomonas sp. ASV322]MDQ4501908.1 acyltransferase [Sinomonas sp. ASV322]
MTRFRELDGLRGIAAIVVVGSHFTGAYNSRYPDDPVAIVDLGWGAYGVQLFFLISGFVILMSASRAQRPSDFVISRAARLYPAYWLSLALAVGVGALARVPHVPLDPWVIVANLSMVQRWFLVENVNDVYWTLAIEMQFYALIVVLLVATRSRISDRLVAWLVVVWLVVALAVAWWAGPFSRGTSPQNVIAPVKMVLNVSLAEFGPLFSLGMLAYLSRREGRLHPLVPVAAAVAAAVAWILHSWVDGLWVAGICAGFIAVVLRPTTKPLTTPPVQWLGARSYSLYVVHSILGFALIRWLWPVTGRDLAMPAAFAVVLLATWACHAVGEQLLSSLMRRAMLRWRDRNRESDRPAEGQHG